MKGNYSKSLKGASEKITKAVNPKIKELLNLYTAPRFRKLVNYQIEAGGKRFRPLLTVTSCLACGGKMNDALYPAAGLEILHNYSLIIDDIIDHSRLRRGKPTVWAKFGTSMAKCAAIDYSAAMFQAANRSKKPAQISELFAKTVKTIVEGEILDILFEQSGRTDEKFVVKNRYKKISQKDYFSMAGKKTAVLIQTCCEVGGICARAKKKEIESLKKYGFNLGVAFQISDDVLDIFGQQEKFGKKIGNDIKERKLGNIVIFYAQKELSLPDKKRVLSILRQTRIKNGDIKEAIRIIKKTQAKEKALKLGSGFVRKAKRSLKVLPKNKWSRALEDIADFAIEREK